MMTHKKIVFAFAILALGILTGCTSRGGPPAEVHYDKAVSPYHVVKRGESIASIAKKYNMDKRELIRINGIETPYRIVKGQKLLVRVPGPSDDEAEMPATEEVGAVPEESDVRVKPLAPIGAALGAGATASAVASEGRDFGQNETPYTDDTLNESPLTREGGAAPQSVDHPTRIPDPPAAANTYIQPVQGTVIRGYNPNGSEKTKNLGINIAAPKGSPVVAANNGVVAYAGNKVRGFGNVALVKHGNGTVTVYGHLDKLAVKKGDIVSAGQKLGTVGKTGGTVTEPQLHFEIRQGEKSLDPNLYLR